MSNLGLITHAEKLITLSTLFLGSIDRDRLCDLWLPHKPGIVLLHPLPNFVCFKVVADVEQETRKGTGSRILGLVKRSLNVRRSSLHLIKLCPD